MPLSLIHPNSSDPILLWHGHILKGPRAARVYLVPHNRGWYAIPLTPAGGVTLPGDPPRLRLHFGDELTVGGLTLQVDEATSADESPLEAGGGDTACRFEVAGNAPALAAADCTLVGSADHCHYRVAPEFGVAPVHAAIARVEGRWVLYDLLTTKPKAGVANWFALRDGDEVRVGPLAFTFEIFPADELRAADTDTVAAAETADLVALAEWTGDDPPPADAGVAADFDTVVGPASLVCRWVQIAAKEARPHLLPPMPTPEPPDPRGVAPAALARLKELAGHATRLEAHPADKAVLARFARFLADCGYADLYRLMARRLFHLDQADPHAAAAVAEAYLAAGREPEVEPGEKLKRLAEAERFAAAAVELAPRTTQFRTLRDAIAVEQMALGLRAARPAARPVPGATP